MILALKLILAALLGLIPANIAAKKGRNFVGWWFYGEALDAYVFAGAGLIMLGISWNLRAEAIAATKLKR